MMVRPDSTDAATSTGLPTVVDAAPINRSRRVEQVHAGLDTQDGAGVRLTRLLRSDLQRRLDPFLMLDAFGSDSADDYIGGFPDHPHRGFETVTVMLAGRMRHRDSMGNQGLLEPGSVQWMTAGSGLVHSEMPEQSDGRMAGFQLWVNLAAADKLQPPAYRDMPPGTVPQVVVRGRGSLADHDGVRVRVLAGYFGAVAGAVQRPTTEPVLLDITLAAGRRCDVALPPGHRAFVVVFAEPGLGHPVDVGADAAGNGVRVPLNRLAVLTDDPAADGVRLSVPDNATQSARVLLVSGRPLNEPVVQYGPFVMNTAGQIHEAIADFQAGRLG